MTTQNQDIAAALPQSIVVRMLNEVVEHFDAGHLTLPHALDVLETACVLFSSRRDYFSLMLACQASRAAHSCFVSLYGNPSQPDLAVKDDGANPQLVKRFRDVLDCIIELGSTMPEEPNAELCTKYLKSIANRKGVIDAFWDEGTAAAECRMQAADRQSWHLFQFDP
ncbi:MAG: hypothetical protein O3A00_16430 [Planctomycetota bacterium]|nr:hypothetical protein [Planctomycetota bacterium]